MKRKPKTLKPILYNENWHKKLSRELIELYQTTIYDPLLEAIEILDEPKTNAKETPLTRALKNGSIRFWRSGFHGKMSASISKELKENGAIWRNGRWTMLEAQLPNEWRSAINANKSLWRKLMDKIDEKFFSMADNVQTVVNNMSLENLGLENMDQVSRQFKKELRDKVSIKTDLGQTGVLRYIEDRDKPIKKQLAREFDKQTKKYSSDFAYDEIVQMRKHLSELITSGAPRKDVREYINSRIKVGKNRARFIARQETALLTNEVKEVEYKQVGIKGYIWVSQSDGIVRPEHKALNNQTIMWDNPPIVDLRTGRRAHAGSDFNCFIPSTDIRLFSKPIKTLKRWYSGNVIQITMDDKTMITATPNHPILTLDGWKPFNMLKNGDKLLKRNPVNIFGLGSANINHRHTASNVHDFFAVGNSTMSRPGTDIDFHGDGSNFEIEVVSSKGGLLDKFKAIFFQEKSEFVLSNTFSAKCFFKACSALVNFMLRHNPIKSGSVSVLNLVDSLGLGHVRPFQAFGLGLVADDNAKSNQNSVNGASRNLKVFTDLINALARKIIGLDFDQVFIADLNSNFTVHEITSLKEMSYNGYVHNFETNESVYLAESYLVSNCRCQQKPVVEW